MPLDCFDHVILRMVYFGESTKIGIVFIAEIKIDIKESKFPASTLKVNLIVVYGFLLNVILHTKALY